MEMYQTANANSIEAHQEIPGRTNFVYKKKDVFCPSSFFLFKKKEKTLLLSVRLGAKAQYGGCVQWMLWVGGYRLGSSECI